MCFCHSIMLAAVSEAVMMANSPLPPRIRAALSIRVWPIPSGVAWLTKKSRASGSASASQVMTLIPALARLAQHRGDPLAVLDGHGDDVDPARDPGVDHLVLLGRVGVGRPVPDQLDAQLPGGLLGPLAAGDEVGVALALGHHGHGDRGLVRVQVPRSAWLVSRSRELEPAGRNAPGGATGPGKCCWPRSISAAARITRADHGHLRVLHGHHLLTNGCDARRSRGR